MADTKTKKGYALIAWDDANGHTEPGQAVDLPFDTPEDVANYERLVAFGYISEKKAPTTSG